MNLWSAQREGPIDERLQVRIPWLIKKWAHIS
jgi:hypothetical protein